MKESISEVASAPLGNVHFFLWASVLLIFVFNLKVQDRRHQGKPLVLFFSVDTFTEDSFVTAGTFTFKF